MMAGGIGRIGAAIATAVALLVGCGSPAYTYVENAEQRTYFKVPRGWQQIDRDELARAITGADPNSAAARARNVRIWTVAYDAAEAPSVSHVLGLLTTNEPVVWAKVEQLVPAQQDIVSFDTLRNAVVPVTADARAEAAKNGFPLDNYELLFDRILTPQRGLHGVRVVFNYRLPGGVLHTFDQTALVNNDSTRLYFLLIRCSARCYRERFDELRTIAGSFTVRSD